MDFLSTWTDDDLRLPGIHYPGTKTCVIFIHGMAGNIIENYFAQILGQSLAKEGYGFLFGHNRGYSLMNDIATPPRKQDGGYTFKRYGVAYERFEECIHDIDAWLATAAELGYEQVILMGHSLGTNKAIFYLYKKKVRNIKGLVLLSPPDLLSVAAVDNPDAHKKNMAQASQLIKDGQPAQLLDEKLWDWCYMSAQTYLDLFDPSSAANNISVTDRKVPQQLANVHCPVLALAGEYDDIRIGDSLQANLEKIKAQTINAPKFDIHILAAANHNYENKEKKLADYVTAWIKSITQ